MGVERLERRRLLDCSQVLAAAGALDSGFGINGVAVTPPALATAVPLALAVQKDGKIVEAGTILNGPLSKDAITNETLSGQLFVARFNADGKTLDPTFGQGGTVITPAVRGDVEAASSVLVEPDGKVLVAGATALTSSATPSAFVVRYNPDGSSDASFGQGGTVTAPLAGLGQAMTLALDGNTILVGLSASSRFVIMRLNADGTPDAAFGTGGVASTTFAGPGGSEANDEVAALAVGPGGTIDAAGTTNNVPGSGLTSQAVVAAFSDTGAVVNQKVVALGNSSGGSDQLKGLALQPDGKLVLTGLAAGSFNGTGSIPATIVLTRLNPDLSTDTGFGTGGLFQLPVGFDTVSKGIILQPNGDIVATGGIASAFGASTPALFRLTPAGQLDPTFGNGGVVSMPLGPTQIGIVTALAVDPLTGGLVTGGALLTLTNITANNFQLSAQPFLERFLGSPLTVSTPVFGPGSLQGVRVFAPKGRRFTHPVAIVTLSPAALSCFNPDDFRANISWGDGTASRGVFGPGPFGTTAVIGTHRYAHRGTFRTQILVDSAASGSPLAATQGLILVGKHTAHRPFFQFRFRLRR